MSAETVATVAANGANMPVNLPENERRYVVLDSTLFVSRMFNLSAPDFHVLARGAELGFLRVVVPEVVVEEVVRKFEERLTGALDRAHKEFEDVERLTGAKLLGTISIEKDVRAFRARLNAWCTVVDALIPTVEHTSTRWLFERSLKRRKPFQSESDRGMRDALVWASVVQLSERVRYVALVSGNSRDFGGAGEGLLHADLLEDLKSRSTRLKAELHRDVSSLRRAWLNEELDVFQDEADIVDAESVFGSLDLMRDNESEIRWEIEKFLKASLPREFGSPDIQSLEAPSRIEVTSTNRSDVREIEVEATLTFDVVATGIVRKADAFVLEKLPGYQVDVWDYDEFTTAMSLDTSVDVRVNVIVNMVNRSIEAFQVNGVVARPVPGRASAAIIVSGK